MKLTDSTSLSAGTPSIHVMDNRGFGIRALQYNRIAAGDEPDELITRSTLNDDGHGGTVWDPRLFSAVQTNVNQVPNSQSQLSLAGQSLRSDSVDAGWQVALYDAVGRLVWAKDARGTIARYQYDQLGRLTATYEQASGQDERVSDYIIYGDNDPQNTAPEKNNARGQVVRSYDTGGFAMATDFSLQEAAFSQSRQLLSSGEQHSDWQGNDEAAWQDALDATVYTTRWSFNALGNGLSQTDAMGNQQRGEFDVAGILSASYLTLKDGEEQPVLNGLTYNAAGRRLTETAGNGMVTAWGYEPETLRLTQINTSRPASDGRSTQLQDLTYTYDPVGNIVSINNGIAPTRYANNQAVVAQNSYGYDALYQLLGASGRESNTAPRQGSGLPDPISDSSQVTNYTRNYSYDRGGNLIKIQHSGAQQYTNTLVVDDASNRAVVQNDGETPISTDVAGFFDSKGNLQQLSSGPTLSWDEKNQLLTVITVARDTVANSDREVYQYAGGQRIRKQTITQTSGTVQTAEVIYLPGLEIRTTRADNGNVVNTLEELHVISVGGGRALHWESGQPVDIPVNQLRFSIDNQIGSSLLELDGDANILTEEEYYPFGGTALQAATNSSEVKYKFVRYSGKERDNTGLYYYGHRYYMSWGGRWLNPDPAGMVDGPNVYGMVRNNPVSFKDSGGFAAVSPEEMGLTRDEFKAFHELAISTGWEIHVRSGNAYRVQHVGNLAGRPKPAGLYTKTFKGELYSDIHGLTPYEVYGKNGNLDLKKTNRFKGRILVSESEKSKFEGEVSHGEVNKDGFHADLLEGIYNKKGENMYEVHDSYGRFVYGDIDLKGVYKKRWFKSKAAVKSKNFTWIINNGLRGTSKFTKENDISKEIDGIDNISVQDKIQHGSHNSWVERNDVSYAGGINSGALPGVMIFKPKNKEVIHYKTNKLYLSHVINITGENPYHGSALLISYFRDLGVQKTDLQDIVTESVSFHGQPEGSGNSLTRGSSFHFTDSSSDGFDYKIPQYSQARSNECSF